MSPREHLLNTLARREAEAKAAAPVAAAQRVQRMQETAERERTDRANLQAVLTFCDQFRGVVASGYEIKVGVVPACWMLGLSADGFDWVQIGVEYWHHGPGAIPRTIPLLLARWGGHDYELLGMEARKGYNSLDELTCAILKTCCQLDGQYIKDAIDRSRGLRR